MSRRLLPLTTLALALVLAGCTASPSTSSTGTGSPTVAPTMSSTPTATPSATPASAPLIIGPKGITIGDKTVALTAGADMLAAITALAGGPAPTQTPFDGPYNGPGGTTYKWDAVTVSVWKEAGDAGLIVHTATIGTTPVRTASGIGVGSTRAEVIAAGGTGGWDENGDGIVDYLDVDAQPAPGTTSLRNPGSVGVDFVMVKFTGDVVTQLQIAANDYSDL